MELNLTRPDAVARISGGKDAPRLNGMVKFYQNGKDVLVVADISGLPRSNPSGFFGLHIHEGSSCTGPAFADTKGHYDTAGTPHPAHAGDLPPLLSREGRAWLSVLTDRFKVSDIIGRTVVIHSGPDDFRAQPAGNAGTKIACGIIK